MTMHVTNIQNVLTSLKIKKYDLLAIFLKFISILFFLSNFQFMVDSLTGQIGVPVVSLVEQGSR